MEQLILNIKDSSKLSFLMQLIRQLDFVEVEKVKKKKASAKYDFFASAGLWANRELNAKELRKQAWDRTK
jgi:DNA polymerase IIIc chi subunit